MNSSLKQLATAIGLAALSLPSYPQNRSEPAGQTPSRTTVITLGTQGGPVPSRNRAQPANAVLVNGSIYLVDAGNGVVRQLVLAGLDYRKINQIFITHNHDDHNADWGTLMGLQWSTGRRTPITVYGPFGTVSMLEGYLHYFDPNMRIRGADAPMGGDPHVLFKAVDIVPGGVVYQDENVKITSTEVCHYHFDPSKVANEPHKALAFRFETSNRVIVFSGDTGACPSLIAFAHGADLLIHEVVSLPLVETAISAAMASQQEGLMRHMREDHTSPEDIGKLATAAAVKTVILTHFVPGRDTDPDSAYLEGVRKTYAGPVIAAHDLMQF